MTELPGSEFHAGATKSVIGWLVAAAAAARGGVDTSPLELCLEEVAELVWSEGGYSSDGRRR